MVWHDLESAQIQMWPLFGQFFPRTQNNFPEWIQNHFAMFNLAKKTSLVA
ncbi:MAG: hypothetical protein IT270_07065 [Saprospiraceae bacterium]|nr:hypothetical protein [Saprospiraceae bacterium]